MLDQLKSIDSFYGKWQLKFARHSNESSHHSIRHIYLCFLYRYERHWLLHWFAKNIVIVIVLIRIRFFFSVYWRRSKWMLHSYEVVNIALVIKNINKYMNTISTRFEWKCRRATIVSLQWMSKIIKCIFVFPFASSLAPQQKTKKLLNFSKINYKQNAFTHTRTHDKHNIHSKHTLAIEASHTRHRVYWRV